MEEQGMFPNQIDWGDAADIAHWLGHLRQKLSRRYRHLDTQLLDGSIEDALLHYQRCPQCFDVSRGVPLLYYLVWRTRHYLDKRLQKMKRRRQREKAAGISEKNFEKIVSEVRGRGGIYLGEERTEQEIEEQREEAERRQEGLAALLLHLNSHDRCGLYLFLLGASCEKWVQHLGIERLPPEEQRCQVNREKDRLKKKLRRWAQKMRGGLDLKTERKFGQPVLTRVESANHGGCS
jgi:hypothetical protein